MEGSIRTQFDDLINALKEAKGRALSLSELSSKSSLSHSNVMMWLSVLERAGQVKVENKLGRVYASWIFHDEAPEEKKPVRESASEGAIHIAREIAEKQKATQKEEEKGVEESARHREILLSAASEMAKVNEQLQKLDEAIAQIEAEAEKSQKPKKAAKKPAKKKSEEEAPKKIEEEMKAEDDIIAQIEQEIGMSVPVPPEEEKLPELAEEERKGEVEGEPAFAELMESEQAAVASSLKPISLPKTKPSKIKKPAPVQVSSVSLQFSERLARQIKKILDQSRRIDEIRQEKERLLTEHYMPMQRRLEAEIETISDRILKMEKNILSLHQRAADLPEKVSAVEKLQHHSIKAHEEMRRAFDEASALIEESARALAEERAKMEEMLEISRSEIAEHRAKSEELDKALQHISKLEEESASLVISARAALAEQAERLATAERYSQDLANLKAEIKESADSIKREIAATKGVLTGIEKQIEQLRKIELYAQSIKEDYEQKMISISDYIKHGNEEFETLREAVEANFVRRYLRELRQLTDSYSFEFGQVKAMESNLEARIAEEKRKLEELIEEGRKISYLYETQSREVAGESKFEERAEAFKAIANMPSQRQQLQQLVMDVLGKGKAEPEATVSVAEKLVPKVKPFKRKEAPAAKRKKTKGIPAKKKTKISGKPRKRKRGG
ncbi:MAG: hypothetical protein N3G22_04155 [Candidatus Micrarchaeota archaeon]|nr:hypothetical protein [Candidatus Micrarchaeota archaeon]